MLLIHDHFNKNGKKLCLEKITLHKQRLASTSEIEKEAIKWVF